MSLTVGTGLNSGRAGISDELMAGLSARANSLPDGSTLTGGLKSFTMVDDTPLDSLAFTAPPAPVAGDIGIPGTGYVALAVLNDITDTGGTLDGTALTLTVSDPGYDENGNATTVSRVIYGEAFLRRQQPNADTPMISTDGTDLSIYLVMDDCVYSGTTITSVSISASFYTGAAASRAGTKTNSSDLAYKKPGFAFVPPPFQYNAATTLYVEGVPMHRHAMNGRQVACVKYQANDGAGGHTGSVSTVSATTLSTLVGGPFPPETYAASVDCVGLNNGACSVDAVIYPWIGDSTGVRTLSTSGYSWPTSIPLIPLQFYNDQAGTHGRPYAYVKSGASGGTVSTTASDARADPYPTLVAAAAALVTFNNTAATGHTVHSTLSGSVIRLMDDGAGGAVAHSLTANITNSPGSSLCIIQPDPLNTAAVSVTSTVQRTSPHMMWWQVNLTAGGAALIVGSSTANGVLVIGNNSATDIDVDNTTNRVIVGLFARKYLYNLHLKGGNVCDFNNSPMATSSINAIWGLRIATSADGIATNNNRALVMVSMKLDNAKTTSGPQESLWTNGAPDGDHGRIIYNSHFWRLFLRNQSAARTNNDGIHIKQCLFEFEPGATGTNTAFHLYADNDLTTCDDVDVGEIDVFGDRTSFCYNDVDGTKILPAGIYKFGYLRNSVVDFIGVKADTFNSDDGSTGNMSFMYWVGSRGLVSLFGTASRLPLAAPNNGATASFLGNAWPLIASYGNEYNLQRLSSAGTDAGKQADVMDNDFENYLVAPRAVPAMGGDYRPSSTSRLKSRVPAERQGFKYDLAGALRKTDGTGATGCYEAVS